jgi:thiol-disulfide isomerase/thioredoxin
MLLRLVVIAALLAVASAGYVWWSRRQGVVRDVEAAGALTPAELGGPRGPRGTLVQFSTPVCAKCPPTKTLLLRVAEDYPGVTHLEIDASEHLDLARRLDIMRTPTTLLLDSDGVVISRMNGAPTEASVREALDALPRPHEYEI